MTEGVASTTIFSLSADSPATRPAGLRGDDTALDQAWLASESARSPCRITRFSSAGAALLLPEPLDPDRAFHMLELQNGQAIEGRIDWTAEAEAGFVFAAPIDVVSTLARNLALLPAERRRVPRVELNQAVGIRHGELFEIARTRDLSQAGVGVAVRLPLEANDAVQIAFDGLHPMTGTVRWAEHGKAGIAFDAELPWQALMPWLRGAQNATAWRTQLPPGREETGFLVKDKAAIRLDTPARVREGTRWWNVQVRMLTQHLVEFDSGATLSKGTQLWVWLPGTAGWPASLIEADHGHYLAEFRLPLRQRDLDTLIPSRIAQG